MKRIDLKIYLFICLALWSNLNSAQSKLNNKDSTSNDFKLEKSYDHPFWVLNFWTFKKFTKEKPSKFLKLCRSKKEIFLTIRDDVDDSTIVCFNQDTIVNSYLKYEPSAGVNRKEILLKIDRNLKAQENYIDVILVNKGLFLRFQLEIKHDWVMLYFDERRKDWTIHYDFKRKKHNVYM